MALVDLQLLTFGRVSQPPRVSFAQMEMTKWDAGHRQVKPYMNISDLAGSERQSLLPEVHGAIPLSAPGHWGVGR